MTSLPTGRVTFLFTDIEGSTSLFRRLGEEYPRLLEAHRLLMREAINRHGGVEVGTEGDSFFVAFPDASAALETCLDAQLGLLEQGWPEDAPIRVRMGLHTGEARPSGNDYTAIAVHQAARVQSAAHGGQVLLTQDVLEAARELPRELSVRDLGLHTLKDFPTPIPLFQLSHAQLPEEFPPIKALSVLPDNLPRARTSFVGRQKEVGEVRTLVESTPLLTLTGPGGSGKTRLAVEIANATRSRFAHGTRLVELAPLGEANLVGATILHSLGLREETGLSPSETVIDFCRSRKILIILDNCEHVIEAVAEIADQLLENCSELYILATSREALCIPGEHVYAVPTLETPHGVDGTDPESILRLDAVRLFSDRASAVCPTFRLDHDNAGRVGVICARLDGIPLAIELAAARLRTLSLDELERKLADRFRLLTSGARTATARQQTLRAAIDWSYELLTSDEKRLFARLAVFAGGFTLSAVENICSQDSDNSDVTDSLSQLLVKSLVEKHPSAEGRYRMLETIREYAGEKLTVAGEADRIRELHSDYYLALVSDIQDSAPATNQSAIADLIDADHDNVRAALIWNLSNGDTEAAQRYVAALHDFWRGRFPSEGLRWTEQALTAGESPPHVRFKALLASTGYYIHLAKTGALRAASEEALQLAQEVTDESMIARAVIALGTCEYFEGNLQSARDRFEESLALAKSSDDPSLLGRSLNNLALVVTELGDLRRGRTLLEEKVRLDRSANDLQNLSVGLGNLGLNYAWSGDYEFARKVCEEAVEASRRLGDTARVGWSHSQLATIEWLEGRLDSAALGMENTIEIAEAIDDEFLRDTCHRHLALINCRKGDPALARSICGQQDGLAARDGEIELAITGARLPLGGTMLLRIVLAVFESRFVLAAQHIREALDVARSYNNSRHMAELLLRLALVAPELDASSIAARLLGALDRWSKETGYAVPHEVDRQDYAKAIDKARANLGAALEDEWASGTLMPFDEVVAYALNG